MQKEQIYRDNKNKEGPQMTKFWQHAFRIVWSSILGVYSSHHNKRYYKNIAK
jgi:hypothetical protein